MNDSILAAVRQMRRLRAEERATFARRLAFAIALGPPVANPKRGRVRPLARDGKERGLA